jgi:hypothetical protein
VLAEAGLSSCRIDGRTSKASGSGGARQSAAMERHAVATAFNDKYELDLGDIDGTGRF